MTPVLESERLLLRPVGLDDCNETYLRWMNDYEVVRYTESRFGPTTMESLRAYVEAVSADPRYLFLAIVAKDGRRHIGNIKLGPINPHHRFGDVGIIIGEKPYWGKGYATETISILTRHAFEKLDLHKLTASCYATNRSSVKAFVKAGFVEEGGRPSHFLSEGSWVDIIQLGMLAPRGGVEATAADDFQRLEHLFRGEFEDSYIERNKDAANLREPFWAEFLSKHTPKSVLEVGCGTGFNLRWIAERLQPTRVFGVDINERALAELRVRLPRVNAVWGRAWELPFRDAAFDLTFTVGLLMHQTPATVMPAAAELVRCSRDYVLVIEYFGTAEEEIQYRGLERALYRRDYGALFREHFPWMTLAGQGELTREAGWDNVTWWLFRKG